jgi:hypothetical protein
MTWSRFHLGMTAMWALLIPPSVIWWSQSVPWIVLMSVWANFASHFSAYQAARAEEK